MLQMCFLYIHLNTFTVKYSNKLAEQRVRFVAVV